MCLIQLANLLVIPQRKAQNLNNPQNTSFPILCCLKGSVTSVMEFSKLIENYCGLLSKVCGQKKEIIVPFTWLQYCRAYKTWA